MKISKQYKNVKNYLKRLNYFRTYKYLGPIKTFMTVNQGSLSAVYFKLCRYIERHKLTCPFDRSLFYVDDKLKLILETKEDILAYPDMKQYVAKNVKLKDTKTTFV